MWFAEVAGGDRAVDRRDDLSQRDLLRGSSQHIAAPDAALGPDQPGSLEGKKDLLEVGLGQPGPHRYVTDRSGHFGAVESQREERPAGVVTSC
jgi:hypothetical protein